ncbi:hypothetical protein [Pseudomonas borbori]|uniref:Uncharacterized protein n=1 Tax=Pseudomonas borbori TaxID=289003 RepID=A0A1I5VEF2_9PSED|nr:hypothetical protein [Pseudomonas borbori]SFQ05948.1 hypothetical protein SAMN05216190_13052 [Pseudomonas borbori]
MTSKTLYAIKASRKTGEEPLIVNDKSVALDLLSFWQWSSSDLISNSLRGVLAEYIVASTVGCNTGVRTEWDAYDLKTESGIRIEVKSAAYLQSWSQKKLSNISFSVRPAHGWDAESNSRSKIKIRPSHVYVFCVLKHKEKSTVNPLNMDQWGFYCINTTKLNNALGSQKSISHSRLLSLEPIKSSYLDLAETIKSVAESSS